MDRIRASYTVVSIPQDWIGDEANAMPAEHSLQLSWSDTSSPELTALQKKPNPVKLSLRPRQSRNIFFKKLSLSAFHGLALFIVTRSVWPLVEQYHGDVCRVLYSFDEYFVASSRNAAAANKPLILTVRTMTAPGIIPHTQWCFLLKKTRTGSRKVMTEYEQKM